MLQSTYTAEYLCCRVPILWSGSITSVVDCEVQEEIYCTVFSGETYIFAQASEEAVMDWQGTVQLAS
jgi:hypothetical protein